MTLFRTLPLLVTAATLLTPSSAEASVGAASCHALSAPSDAATIPANVKGVFAYVSGPVESFSLRPDLRADDATLNLVPATTTGGVLALNAPLVAGKGYTFSFDEPPLSCRTATPAEASGRKTVRFTAGPASPIPKRVGKLFFVGAAQERGFVTLRMRAEIDPALAPFREVSSLVLHRDDEEPFHRAQGATPTFAGTDGLDIYASCSERVGEIRETWRLDGYVFGETEPLEGAAVGVQYTCLPEANADIATPATSGDGQGGSSSGARGEGGGCSLEGRRGGAAGASAWGAIALFVLARARRRGGNALR